MQLFTTNAGTIISTYSKDFETHFLSCLKMRHGTKKVNANNVYQEMIAYKQHIHMNSTQWTTLSEFVQYLGKCGICMVEENTTDGQGGWYVSFIERDTAILQRREQLQKRESADQAAEYQLQQRMKKQRIEAAKAFDKMQQQQQQGSGGRSSSSGITIQREATSMDPNKQPMKVTLGVRASEKKLSTATGTTVGGGVGIFGDDDDDDDDENDQRQSKNHSHNSAMSMMMASSIRRAEENNNNSSNNNNEKVQYR
mmetsp:Transcript_60524/g.69576  ORF Transcript_60524/g.69576 Transcript_60524/m.69576 type:complete len:254 (+) Transcript_60524:264-1025(+)